MDKLNSLPDLLRRLGVGRDARVLDIRSNDGASTDHLVEAVDGVVDVVASDAAGRARVAGHGERVRFVDSEYAADAGVYDAVVTSPVLAKVAENLRDTAWRAPRLLRPGGVWITFGIDPKTLGDKGCHQPSATVAAEFRRDFGVTNGEVTRLPEAFGDRFELAASAPRKPIQRSYLTWTAFRLSKAGRAVRRVGVFTDVRAHSLIDDLPGEEEAAAGAALAREFKPDTLMVVDNEVRRDARVSKTAETVRDFGRRVLCTGIHEGETVKLISTVGGVPAVLYPSPRVEVERRLRIVGGPLDQGVRRELRMAAYGRWLAGLIEAIGPGRLIVHGHDFQSLYVVGVARELVKTAIPWVHDSHEFTFRYELIDPDAQAIGVRWERYYLPRLNAHTCVSEEQAEAMAAEYGVETQAVIYNTQRLAGRHKYHGRTLRQRLGLGREPLLVHSGSVREGRGIEHLVRVMPDFPDVNLALLTGSKGPFIMALLKEAEALGVRGRLHLCAPLPYDEVTGFIADADAGVIPMDSYGNAELSLPNKLFDYLLAGLPVLSTSTGALKRLFEEWPVGPMYPPSDDCGLRGALTDLLANRAGYAAEVERRPDLLAKYAWEAQAVKLKAVYDRLPLAAKGRVR